MLFENASPPPPPQSNSRAKMGDDVSQYKSQSSHVHSVYSIIPLSNWCGAVGKVTHTFDWTPATVYSYTILLDKAMVATHARATKHPRCD